MQGHLKRRQFTTHVAFRKTQTHDEVIGSVNQLVLLIYRLAPLEVDFLLEIIAARTRFALQTDHYIIFEIVHRFATGSFLLRIVVHPVVEYLCHRCDVEIIAIDILTHSGTDHKIAVGDIRNIKRYTLGRVGFSLRAIHRRTHRPFIVIRT